jgi:hypothetical protein
MRLSAESGRPGPEVADPYWNYLLSMRFTLNPCAAFQAAFPPKWEVKTSLLPAKPWAAWGPRKIFPTLILSSRGLILPLLDNMCTKGAVHDEGS